VTGRARLIAVRRKYASEIPRRTYLTHGVDRYPAKMVPHLARYAIERVSTAGQTVLDPFCGCGTVLIESLMTQRHACGLDVNPVAVVLARAKSSVYSTDRLLRKVEELVDKARSSRCFDESPAWLQYWFSPVTLRKLLSLRAGLQAGFSHRRSVYSDLLSAILAISVRKCSRADPRSPKPFISKRARRERCGRHFDPYIVYRSVAAELAKRAGEFFSRIPSQRTSVETRILDARFLRVSTFRRKVDAVVTSPPYLAAQDYYRSSKLELAILGLWKPGVEATLGSRILGSGRGPLVSPTTEASLASASEAIGRLQGVDERSALTVACYVADMRTVLHRIADMLSPGSRCCFILGDCTMCGVKLPVHTWAIEAARLEGFELYAHEVDAIRDRRLPPKREGHRSVIDTEHLLFLRRT